MFNETAFDSWCEWDGTRGGVMKKKLLLLGGSAQQIVAIEAAKELGYFTVLIDYLSDNPGQNVADKFYQESTTDIETVYRIAKDEQVSGILAYASDPAALPAAIVAERLGLPTNPAKSVAVLGLKDKFRDFLEEHGFSVPKHCSFKSDISEEELKKKIKDFKFPIVIKPTDSSGSKGVSFLVNESEIVSAIQVADTHSRNKIFIVEEFIQRGFPDVIGGDVFVWDGKIVLHGEMACLRGEYGNGLVPLGEKKPHGLAVGQLECVKYELQRLVSALGIKIGELNVEILLDKENKVFFLEVGPRAGGNMIPLQLSDVFGVDLVKANVQVAMGETPNLTLNEQSGCFVTYVLHSYLSGIFERIAFSPKITPFIYRKVIYKKAGDNVGYFDGAGKAVGIVFLRFNTEEQMQELCMQLENLIKVILK